MMNTEFHKKNSMQIHPEFTSHESIGRSGGSKIRVHGCRSPSSHHGPTVAAISFKSVKSPELLKKNSKQSHPEFVSNESIGRSGGSKIRVHGCRSPSSRHEPTVAAISFESVKSPELLKKNSKQSHPEFASNESIGRSGGSEIRVHWCRSPISRREPTVAAICFKSVKSPEFHKKNSKQSVPEFASHESIGRSGGSEFRVHRCRSRSSQRGPTVAMKGLKSAKSAELHKKNSKQSHPEFTSHDSIGRSAGSKIRVHWCRSPISHRGPTVAMRGLK
jgi:hypothetical protein